jgi:hypothetical protein
MKWIDVRQNYPGQWLLVEAITAHSEGEHRILDELAVVDTFPDSIIAWRRYSQMHNEAANREFYILHTDREQFDITERVWLGIRLVE